MGYEERDVKVFHTLQKNKIWYSFIISDISDKIKNDLKTIGIKSIDEYKGHYFIYGQYDNNKLDEIRNILRDSKHKEIKGDYFNLSSRYDLWEIINSENKA